jgi:hypothetical protein
MNLIHKVSIFGIILLLYGFSLSAQTRTVTGAITDDKHVPLPGATIRVKNSNAAAVSDVKGNFSINVPEGAVLQISFTGMETQEVAVQQRSTVNVSLKLSSTSLSDVVVVGYGLVRKRDLTGTVASIKGAEITKSAVSSLEQGLQGRIAGVAVSQNDAAPGGGISVQVRGTSTLLGSSEPL